jgi:hypothetical protein
MVWMSTNFEVNIDMEQKNRMDLVSYLVVMVAMFF